MSKVICYGDSNTYGWDPTDFWGTPYKNPWPALVSKGLNLETVNLGEPGRCIPVSCGMDNLRALIDRFGPADAVLVMLGTNDILNESGRGLSRIADRMDQLIVSIADQKVVLVALPPARTGSSMIDEAVDLLNEEYRKLAELRGIKFISLDGVEIPLAFDGVHLTEEAHANLAEVIIKEIKEYI